MTGRVVCMVTLTGFADEIAPDLTVQLDTLEEEGISHLELRGIWGKNVMQLDEGELERARAELVRRGFGVSAIGSPIGKVDVTGDLDAHMREFLRALEIAERFGAPYLRLFSFYIPDGHDPAQYRDTVLHRMSEFARAAEATGITLVHENERRIYGDTDDRCLDILTSVNHPKLRSAFDPANFIQCGVKPFSNAWPKLAATVEYVHVKDAHHSDGRVVPAGQGDGDWPALLGALKERGYGGFMSLEPHLAAGGDFSGFSGPRLFKTAASALKSLLAQADIAWN